MAPVLRQRSPSRSLRKWHLAEAPADARLLLDQGPRLLGGADRVLQEVLLQGVSVLGQDALGLMPWAAAEARQATPQVLVKVALNGAAGGKSGRGGPVGGAAPAHWPQDRP